MSTNLTQKQRQYIFHCLSRYKDAYAYVGTVANAFLCTLLSIGENGIHIKSLEGIHIAAANTKGSPFSGTINYIRTINKVLKQDLGPKAPQLTMDMLGNQRICWKLSEEAAIDEALNELNNNDNNDSNDNQ